MKKLFILCLLFVASATVMAVPQYGSISNASGDAKKADVFVNTGGGSSLQNSMHVNKASYVYLSFSKNAPTNFGVYTLDGNKISKNYSIAKIEDGRDDRDARYTIVDKDNNPIKINAGEVVGFWVEDKDGKIVYNTPKIEGEHDRTYNGTAILNKDEYVIGFGSLGQFVGSGNYEDMFNTSSTVMNVQVGSQNPNGQPLPGVLIALLLGGCAVGARRIMKRKLA